MASSKAVASMPPTVLAKEGELPTLLNVRSRQKHPWNRRCFPTASMQISIPDSEHKLEAYPAEAVRVHNTFIHVGSPNTDSFQRVAQSCPSTHMGRLRDIFQVYQEESKQKHVLCLDEVLFEPSMPSTPEPLYVGRMVVPPCYSLLMSPEKLSHAPLVSEIPEWMLPSQGLLETCQQMPFPGPVPPMPGANPDLNCWAMPPPPPPQMGAYPQQTAFQVAQPLQPPTLWPDVASPQLAQPLKPPTLWPDVASLVTEAVLPVPSEPAPGSAELPSMGSKDHQFGECKPCAFLHAQGCENGAMCKFCHLCDAGEKKRRQKAKKAAFRGGA